MPASLSLVVDIGGTNTRVALAQGARVDRTTIRRFANAEYPGLSEILSTYLAAANRPVCAGVCVAVAGPIDNGVARMTNLDWSIDSDTVRAATQAKHVAILNDLQAQGHALGHIEQNSLVPLIEATERPGASQLVIGVGTGFNAAPVVDQAGYRTVAPAECGQISLPVQNEDDLRLMRFVSSNQGFACVEDALSGRGLERLFAFHAHEADQSRTLDAASIMKALATREDSVAEATGRSFVRLLGAVSGDLALGYLPFGGIFLIGGVARAFAPHYQRFGLAEAFRNKGRFAAFMQNFSVALVEDDYAALEGCARHLAATAS